MTFVALVSSVVVVRFNGKLTERVKETTNSFPGTPADRKKKQILASM